MLIALDSDVSLLRRSLGPLPDPVVRPAFVVVSGLPGSGKSTFSRQLQERIPLAVVESDALRQVLFPQPSHSAEESNRLFAAVHRLVEHLLQEGVPTLLDATNLQERHREHLYHIADRLRAKLVLVWVEAPEAMVQDRLRHRELTPVPADHSTAGVKVYERMSPSAQRISRPHFTVNTGRNVSPALDKIVREVRRLKG